MAVDDLDATTLMPLETPILKVSRPVAACSRCRNAKIKCDGKLPACSSCEKNGRAAECTSTNDQFARGKERSYVSTLETRIDRLQAKLEEVRARKPSVVSLPDETETAVPSRRQSYSLQGEPPSSNNTKAQRRKEASAIDDLVSDFGFLSVNATARDFYGFTSAMSYARLILSACSKDELPRGTTKALPPRYVATQLIQHYLNNFFILLPVFDEASFYASVDCVYARDSRQAEPSDHWTVRMILAIASAAMSEQRGDQHYMEGIGHVCAALEYAEEVLHPGSVSSVQALVLLTEYAMLDPHHFDSWSLIGAASRAMVDLGLHQDPPKGAPMTKGKLELRRRVYHCVYALDRSTSLVQTRAFSFSDDSAKVKIPFSKAPTSLPSSPNGSGPQQAWLQSHEQALDLIELRQLQSTWYTDLFQSGRTRWEEPYQYLWNTCDHMRRWFENLSPSTTPNMRAFFELDLLYSYVYVLSPSPRVPIINPFAAKLIFEYCIRYAELMLRLINDPQYTAPLTFYDAMRVYMTGRQFLDVLQHGTETLLNGFIPPHPEVRPSTAPPPPMPVVQLPHGETLPRFNTLRSMRCIEQITECLSKFGIRWGYMSWHERYRTETSTMLGELNDRLRNLDEMSGRRRPSMWPHSSSAGSVHSNSGSTTYYSPSPPGMPVGPAAYRQPSITAHNMTSYGESNQPLQASPPTHHYTHHQFPGHPVQPFEPSQQQQQFFQHVPGSNFIFSDPLAMQQHVPASVAPTQQFAAWGGYGGHATMPNTLDEENAANSRQSSSHRAFPIQQASQQESLGSMNLLADPEAKHATTVEGQPFVNQICSVPASSVLPDLTSGGPAPVQSTGRRPSMQDFAQDMLQAPLPQGSFLWHPPHVRPPSPRVVRDLRQRKRDKGKQPAGEPSRVPSRFLSDGGYFYNPGEAFPGFTHMPGTGFKCTTCTRVVQQPELHTTNGRFCFDVKPAPPAPQQRSAAAIVQQLQQAPPTAPLAAPPTAPPAASSLPQASAEAIAGHAPSTAAEPSQDQAVAGQTAVPGTRQPGTLNIDLDWDAIWKEMHNGISYADWMAAHEK